MIHFQKADMKFTMYLHAVRQVKFVAKKVLCAQLWCKGQPIFALGDQQVGWWKLAPDREGARDVLDSVGHLVALNSSIGVKSRGGTVQKDQVAYRVKDILGTFSFGGKSPPAHLLIVRGKNGLALAP